MSSARRSKHRDHHRDQGHDREQRYDQDQDQDHYLQDHHPQNHHSRGRQSPQASHPRTITTAITTQQFPTCSSSLSASSVTTPSPYPSTSPSTHRSASFSTSLSGSELFRRNRRRCGGIFVPVRGASEPGVVRYAWPQHAEPRDTGWQDAWPYQDQHEYQPQPYEQQQQHQYQLESAEKRPAVEGRRARECNLSVDALRANEAFFDASHDSHADTIAFSGDKGCMKYDFEKDIKASTASPRTADVKAEPLRNLATRDGVSTRSLSVYSQSSRDEEHEQMELSARPGPGDNVEQHSGRRDAVHLRRMEVFSALPRTRDYTAEDISESRQSNAPPKTGIDVANEEATSLRSTSSLFGRIRKLSNRMTERMVSLTRSITGRFGSLGVRKSKPRKSDKSKGRRQISDGSAGSAAGEEHDAHGPYHSEGDPGLAAAQEPVKREQANKEFFGGERMDGLGGRKVY